MEVSKCYRSGLPPQLPSLGSLQPTAEATTGVKTFLSVHFRIKPTPEKRKEAAQDKLLLIYYTVHIFLGL